MVLFAIYRDPWLSLPFEALEIVTIHLMGVAFSLFCASAAPVGLLATLQGTPDNINFFFHCFKSKFIQEWLELCITQLVLFSFTFF